VPTRGFSGSGLGPGPGPGLGLGTIFSGFIDYLLFGRNFVFIKTSFFFWFVPPKVNRGIAGPEEAKNPAGESPPLDSDPFYY
jgi:hypothetical protein